MHIRRCVHVGIGICVVLVCILKLFDDWFISFRDSAQAHSLDEVTFGRFLVGLGIGVDTVLVPIYISEVNLRIGLVVFAYLVHPSKMMILCS